MDANMWQSSTTPAYNSMSERLQKSHLLAQDWSRDDMAARRGMLSEQLLNEHSRMLQC